MEKTKHLLHNRKVIPLELDAAFFFERAVQSLDRYRYDRALKYFRRAVEYEPNNPVSHCNMAGILSEMGNYAESNRVLRYVVDRIDPTMTECYFYMANNFANMEQFEEAEKALRHYLEHDPYGHYIDESEEMMEMLSIELMRPIQLTKIKSREGIIEHDRARALLEEGKYIEAIKLLEKLVKMYPEFSAAHNNLALAYYYVGRFKDALDAVGLVLEEDPGNLHGLCNLAIFHYFAGNEEHVAEIEATLRKTVPYHQEHAFKLATTMGVLGDHTAALTHFRRLLRTEQGLADPCLHHYAAAACCNLGRTAEARRYWKQAEKLDPGSDVPRFYMDALDELEDGIQSGTGPITIHYYYHLPFEEQIRQLQRARSAGITPVKQDPLLRFSFFWALRHGDRQMKLQVIQNHGTLGDEQMTDALRKLLSDPGEEDYVKKVAVFALRQVGVQETLPAMIAGREVTIEKNVYTPNLPVWQAEWQQIIDLAMERMSSRYDLIQQLDMTTLWVEFLSRTYPAIPKITKKEGWSAALEYLTAKMHRRTATYQDIALRYGVSITTVSRNAKWIDEVCGLREKMNAIFAKFHKKL